MQVTEVQLLACTFSNPLKNITKSKVLSFLVRDINFILQGNLSFLAKKSHQLCHLLCQIVGHCPLVICLQ